MHTHYIDLAPEGRIQFEIYARLLKGVHLANVEGHGLAVDWPEWREERGAFGRFIRIFGTETGLAHLLIERAAPLVLNGLVKVSSGISPVPAGITATHFYLRSRKADKNTPSHRRRLERRAAQRGETYVAEVAKTRPPALHSLRIQSGSTGQSYFMDICRKPLSGTHECSQATADISGLGMPIPTF